MSFSKLMDLKKTENKTKANAFIQHVVVGQNFHALAAFHKLNILHPGQVKIVAARKFTQEDLFFKGPNTLRGPDNVNALKSAHPELEITESDRIPLFYKDQKLREFGGRARPEALLYGEEFYGQVPHSFEAEKLFPFLADQDFLAVVNANTIEAQISDIAKAIPSDLVNRAYWTLSLGDGTELKLEKLFWARSPIEFLETYSEKGALSNDLIQFIESLRTPVSLYVRLEFEKPVTDHAETLFLPLSFTHDWGHFVGEFKSIDGKQVGEFVANIDEEAADEDYISKIIKILKKNIEKISPDVERISCKEFIMLNERSACLKIDDRAYHTVKNDIENAFFVGTNAPLEHFGSAEKSCEDSEWGVVMPTHLARFILSLKQI